MGASGTEITFAPTSPESRHKFTVAGGEEQLYGVSCPSSSECVATTSAYAVIFDPTSGVASRVRLRASTEIWHAVACPTTSECAVVSLEGNELTLDPESPSVGTPASFAGITALRSIACPSSSLCVAVGAGGQEVTFDPAAPAESTAARVDAANQLQGVSCPASNQCTSVDQVGQEATFDPLSRQVVNLEPIATGEEQLLAVGCPSAELCAAIGRQGQAFVFDPQQPSPVEEVQTGLGGPHFAGSISCPSIDQCTANFGVAAATFDPTAPGMVSIIDFPAEMFAPLSCPSVNRCIVVGGRPGFDPMFESTFNPHSTKAPGSSNIPGYYWPFGLSCPSAHQCTTFAETRPAGEPTGESVALTFYPKTQRQPSAVKAFGAVLWCPTTSFCMGTDEGDSADEGRPPTGVWNAKVVAGAHGFRGISCVSSSECVAVDRVGDAFVATAQSRPHHPILQGGASDR